MRNQTPVFVTGMAVTTCLGDSPDALLKSALAGRSGIGHWRGIDVSGCYSKIGGDLSGYDLGAKLAQLEPFLPEEVFARVSRLCARVPWSTRLSVLMAASAWHDAGLSRRAPSPERVATVVAGHNINIGYQTTNMLQYGVRPDSIEPMYALNGLDTLHGRCVSEALDTRGPVYTVGGACASGNLALRSALGDLRSGNADVALVVGAVVDFSPVELQGMALMGALSIDSFNEDPERASRPFDSRREGFVPAHGGAVLVLETEGSLRRRDGIAYAEVLAAAAGCNANHYPNPSAEDEAWLMRSVLEGCAIAPEQVDYISAHATSTPLGDLAEAQAIQQVFGKGGRVKCNAPKSLLGHACWSSAVVEIVLAIEQMRAGRLHPSINVGSLDPAIELDVCQYGPVNHEIGVFMKNAFGFGGLNAISLFRRASR